ncbi:MAG: phosphatase [Eubacteriales bacterium]|nr:phosphatase [Eubacteriales bacterium]
MNYHAVLDMHTHTIASGHAYCTLREMAKAASEKGLKALGITEHAPSMPGSCGRLYFHNLKVIPGELYGIRLFLGSEVNIVDFNGTVDLSDRELSNLDIVIASLHTVCLKPGNREENTRAYVKAMENPYIDVIGHPDDGRYEVDYPAVVEAAARFGKVLELNNHSLEPDCLRRNAKENDTILLELCREKRVPVLMGSDAHFDDRIAEFSEARALLEEVGFPEELVLNRSVDALLEKIRIGKRGK